jgi:HNH endonuclease
LLCPFSLHLFKHHHHIIPVEDGGPDHVLNVVALCPNHHVVLEQIRRHIAPQGKHRTSDWLYKAEGAVDVIKQLEPAMKALMDQLTETDTLLEEYRRGIPGNLHRAFARHLAAKRAKLLKQANIARPRMLVIYRHALAETPLPTSEQEWQLACDSAIESVSVAFFKDVLETQLRTLGLPFDIDFERDFDPI